MVQNKHPDIPALKSRRQFWYFNCRRKEVLIEAVVSMSANGIFISITIIFPDIKCTLKSRNACYYSVQNLLSSSLLYKNIKIKIYRTIILPVVLYGCETWSFTLREERRLRMFENRLLRSIFGPKREEVTDEWRKLHNEELNDR